MAKSFTQLTIEERQRIKVLRMEKLSYGAIAKLLNRSKSTIHSEIKRNSIPCNNGGRWYNVDIAHSKARARRKLRRKPYKMDAMDIAAQVKAGLANYWSPEQISGRMRLAGKYSISHQCIYEWIYWNKKNGGTYYKFLRWNNRLRKRTRNPRRSTRGRISNPVSIDQRPASVSSRRFVGDWEGDTIEGKKGRSRLASMAERKTLYTVIAKVNSKRAADLNASLNARFALLSHLPVRTITVDNGLEFAGHEELSRLLGGQVYFAHPYSSWERGLNENTNGLIRQYFPKGTDFDKVSAEEITHVEQLLNNRPRKHLGYRTPAEVMEKLLRRHTVRIVS